MTRRRRFLAGVAALFGGCVARRESPRARQALSTPTATPTPAPERRLVPVRTPQGGAAGSASARTTDDGDAVTVDRVGEVPNSCYALRATPRQERRVLVVRESFERTVEGNVSCSASVALAGYTRTVPLTPATDRVVVAHPYGARYTFRVARTTP